MKFGSCRGFGFRGGLRGGLERRWWWSEEFVKWEMVESSLYLPSSSLPLPRLPRLASLPRYLLSLVMHVFSASVQSKLQDISLHPPPNFFEWHHPQHSEILFMHCAIGFDIGVVWFRPAFCFGRYHIIRLYVITR